MLAELLAHDGVVEEVHLAGGLGMMALHGGIEAGTAEMARRTAQLVGASLYVVEVPPDLWWHVPSIQFDPIASNGLQRFVDHVDRVVSLHGFGRPGIESTALLGGRNRSMARRIATAMRRMVDGSVIDELEDIPTGLRGVHPRNPVNLPPGAGVQVEMTEDLRTGESATGTVRALAAAVAVELEQVAS